MFQFLDPPTPSPGPENAPAGFLEAPRGILGGVEDWDTSCLDWEARLLDGRSLVPDLPLYGRTRCPDRRAVRYRDWVDLLCDLVIAEKATRTTTAAVARIPKP